MAPALRRSTRRLQSAAVGVVLALTAGYAFVSATFVLPESATYAAVDDAFAPYFSQRWDVFAPRMLKVNSSMQIQVQWRDEGGELVRGDWMDVTGAEMTAVAGHPLPSRIQKNTVNAITTYLGRYQELVPAQQRRVEDTFIVETDDGFAAEADSTLIDELVALGDAESRSDVIRLLRYDYMLVRFADAWGEASIGRPVERVRWRITFQRPNDFAHRADEDAQTPASSIVFGWRQPLAAPSDEVVAVFRDVVDRYAR